MPAPYGVVVLSGGGPLVEGNRRPSTQIDYAGRIRSRRRDRHEIPRAEHFSFQMALRFEPRGSLVASGSL